MSTRDKILQAVKNNKPALIPLQEIPALLDVTEENPIVKFTAILKNLSTEVKEVDGWDEVIQYVSELKQQYKIVTVIDGVDGIVNDGADTINQSAAALASLDYALIKGPIGIAENGAIWLNDKNLPNRLLPFICQHLVLVIEAKDIVSNMHQAYRKIQVNEEGYGVFISGPSKTADIEQSLVIGAHGPLSLRVYIVH
ncbi:MAG: LUD domain-containing protein [Bacteroidota bacterium]|nr:LUD domain-containing protein [Bacteroidota bacterium]